MKQFAIFQRSLLLASATCIPLLLSACDGNNAAASASSVQQVRLVHVDAKNCQQGISNALAEHGIGIAGKDKQADATLEVLVNSDGRNLDQVPEFGGFGAKANYTATLYGEDRTILFSTTGDEGSTSYDEMCEDIGDEIAERLQDRQRA